MTHNILCGCPVSEWDEELDEEYRLGCLVSEWDEEYHFWVPVDKYDSMGEAMWNYSMFHYIDAVKHVSSNKEDTSATS